MQAQPTACLHTVKHFAWVWNGMLYNAFTRPPADSKIWNDIFSNKLQLYTWNILASTIHGTQQQMRLPTCYTQVFSPFATFRIANFQIKIENWNKLINQVRFISVHWIPRIRWQSIRRHRNIFIHRLRLRAVCTLIECAHMVHIDGIASRTWRHTHTYIHMNTTISN